MRPSNSVSSFYLRRPDGHRLHVSVAGPADGEPWVVVHGGPGGRCYPAMTAWFDLARHRVVMPDQRGAGASRPSGSLRRNSVTSLIADLEALRAHLGIARWGVVGGSWGAALALAYAARHPASVARIVLRGSFLTGWDDILRLFSPRQRGLSMLHDVRPAGVRVPDARGAFGAAVNRLLHGARGAQHRLAEGYERVERSALRLRPVRKVRAAGTAGRQRALRRHRYRIQAHYLRHRAWLGKPAVLRAARDAGLQGIPVTILHGRRDRVCDPRNARRLREVLPAATLQWVDAGHLPVGKMAAALKAAIAALPLDADR
ncbi:alpha/beta fold hydrolase [Cupriavidus pauculus]|uniref:Proline iminopeptidase n=1 Tax=Cupriavidus pauculus TaxID=82633 RepID=A0A5P2H0J4_9BURK|nr:alpha/beta fold hydrolase [Cupriavidus pauculus]QET01467.1 alpha/beta fold hydrolase [Cupriavidus pauculus]